MEGRKMPKLTEEQQRQLDELTALQNAPDDDGEFEIEIWNEKGSGARIPYGKGKGWLSREFGIELDAPPEASNGDPNAQDPNAQTDPESTARPRTSSQYFGRNKK